MRCALSPRRVQGPGAPPARGCVCVCVCVTTCVCMCDYVCVRVCWDRGPGSPCVCVPCVCMLLAQTAVQHNVCHCQSCSVWCIVYDHNDAPSPSKPPPNLWTQHEHDNASGHVPDAPRCQKRALHAEQGPLPPANAAASTNCCQALLVPVWPSICACVTSMTLLRAVPPLRIQRPTPAAPFLFQARP